jgi:plastocyanin
MKRISFGIVAAGLAGVAFLVPANASTPKLTGKVGPGFTITLKKGAVKVKTLKAGKYMFAISDKSGIHNFTLEREKGGKFEKTLTDTGFTGNKTVAVTLKKGTYKYYCSIHESEMFGFFKVTS